jgi:tRNA(Ile)-lysidine synthase
MTYLLAISGGVDSVVLLHRAVTMNQRCIVAHVDHGIRTDSNDDARFVRGLARQYRLPYCGVTLTLGSDASEEHARDVRYAWLYARAEQYNATIVTAHHQDDVIGSIAINLIRGTGWRGLAVMNRSGIVRPMIGWTKTQVYHYAMKHRLEWAEDSTNHDEKYLRNRLRAGVIDLSIVSRQDVLRRWQQQKLSAKLIDAEIDRQLTWLGNSRYNLIHIPQQTAHELFRKKCKVATGIQLTRPQVERGVLFCKTARSGAKLQLTTGLEVVVTQDQFIVSHPRE